MESKLKGNIWKTAVFMLLAALVPLFFFAAMRLPANSWPVCLLLQIVYVSSCLFTLIRGSLVIIEDVPYKRKIWRKIFLFSWLIFYPAMCIGWYYLCVVCFIMIFHIH